MLDKIRRLTAWNNQKSIQRRTTPYGSTMNTFDIYADSAANLTLEMEQKYNITVISYVCRIDGNEMACYVKGRPFSETAKKFYDAMRAGSETSTSLVNSEKFYDAIRPSLENGRDVMIITISSGVSGTNMQARLAAEQAMKDFPDRKVIVPDVMNASLGEGLFAVKAAQMRDSGSTIEECAQWIEENKFNMHSEFTVGDLKYLRRGGRISATMAIAGTLLNIKPLLRANGEGKIASAGTERGRKRALARIADTFGQTVIDPADQTIAICHCDCEDDANYLADLIREKGAKDIVIEWYDICTGSHAGPGTVALFYMGDDRRQYDDDKEGKSSKLHNLISRFKR